MGFELKAIADLFELDGDFIKAEPYGEGHINSTFLMETTKEKYNQRNV